MKKISYEELLIYSTVIAIYVLSVLDDEESNILGNFLILLGQEIQSGLAQKEYMKGNDESDINIII